MSGSGETSGADAALPPLAIVGAGSLGQAFATLLAHAGHDVTLVATPRTAAELSESGRIHLEGSFDLDAAIEPGSLNITTALPADGEPLGLLFTTKAHQLVPAVTQLGLPPERVAWAAGVQNGVVKDDVLHAAYGAGRVIGAVTIMGAARIANGRIRVTAPGMTFLGEFGRGPSPRVDALVDALTGAGIPARAAGDVASVIWSKACNATGAFGTWMLAGPDAPLVGYDPDLMRAFLTLVRETAAIARAEGVEVADHDGLPPVRAWVQRPLEELLAELPAPPREDGPRSYPSMLQDRLAGRPLEVEEVFGDLVARAERHDVPAPALTFTRDILRGVARGLSATG
ncbi:ketopantoate reductase family protein [Conexibacter sp. CPCC 206217]|uniref:ketopantoate reductase family protein n=1 Tax=Conexibacter sp. CPCC 206217 TaxID=3064574 RepID=UPI0027193E31|nr:2-dehydropantoate 2-reductase N-terminal domain-containing protein [Conexibacter sp. CPCC 206217]MDO8210335.1 2-dehydropantoate 2-reductase N-terminal domain-containing protein [Conexibacter sp. CPCC 206217]